MGSVRDVITVTVFMSNFTEHRSHTNDTLHNGHNQPFLFAVREEKQGQGKRITVNKQ
jgi:hypothetical protein